MTDRDFHVAIQAEFERLGLPMKELPGLAFGSAFAGDAFLEQIRRLTPGATWRDVFPDSPPDWVPGEPKTWFGPYRPLGPYDYQELPTGPAVHLRWPNWNSGSLLEDFIASTRNAGWPVHGAGAIEHLSSRSGELHAYVVLAHGTTEDRFDDFLLWLETQSAPELAVITRPVGEPYL